MKTPSALRIHCDPICHKDYLKAHLTVNGKRLLFTTGIRLYEIKNGTKGRDLQPYLQPYEARQYEDLRSDLVKTCYLLAERGLGLNRQNIELYNSRHSSHFIKELEKFVRYKAKMVSPVTIRTSYQPLLMHLKKFSPTTYNPAVHDEFYLYLAHDIGLRDTTIGRYFKRLREFLSKYYPLMDRSFIKRLDYPKLIVSLTREEVSRFKSLPKTKSRDLFLCMCYGGFRYSDSQLITSDMIQGNLLPYVQRKTGGIAHAPINDFILACFEEYGGSLPQVSSQVLNRVLKRMGQQLELTRPMKVNRYFKGKTKTTQEPLWTQLQSQVARKTFLTLLIKEGVPVQLAMKFSGHQKYDTVKKHYMGDMTDKLQEIAGEMNSRIK